MRDRGPPDRPRSTHGIDPGAWARLRPVGRLCTGETRGAVWRFPATAASVPGGGRGGPLEGGRSEGAGRKLGPAKARPGRGATGPRRDPAEGRPGRGATRPKTAAGLEKRTGQCGGSRPRRRPCRTDRRETGRRGPGQGATGQSAARPKTAAGEDGRGPKETRGTVRRFRAASPSVRTGRRETGRRGPGRGATQAEAQPGRGTTRQGTPRPRREPGGDGGGRPGWCRGARRSVLRAVLDGDQRL